MDEIDSPWDSDPTFAQTNEWSKLTSDFTNSGYREGITAGKESALQSGFDAGFAQIGVPLGREIGLLRGTASALSTLLSTTTDTVIADKPSLLSELYDIQSQLSIIRFSDIVPRDLEAEQHAKEHLLMDEASSEADIIEDEQLVEKRKMEQLEDMMSSIGTAASPAHPQRRLGPDDVKLLKERLIALQHHLGLATPFN